jgi:hypothetical protein
MPESRKDQFRIPPERVEADVVSYSPTAPQSISHAMEVKVRHEAQLMRLTGVEGVALGEEKGAEVIRVYLQDQESVARLPQALEGVAVRAVVSGKIQAW